ncbi:MAG: hypothetical protein ACI97X_001664 [Oceanospirillaceae bacterium]
MDYVESVNLHRNKLLENWRLLSKVFLEGVLSKAMKLEEGTIAMENEVLTIVEGKIS